MSPAPTSKSLKRLFEPRSFAVIGASPNPSFVSGILTHALRMGFAGNVYPINPNRKNVLGIRAWPSLESLPEPVELAVIVTPANTVPGVMRECARMGVKGAIIISAGFKEVGPEGVKLEQEVLG